MLFGIGHTNLLETYLSPMEYSGTQYFLMRETMRRTHWADGRISTQSMLQGNFAYTRKKETVEGKDYSGLVDWNVGWHYNWSPIEGLRLMAGAKIDAFAGFVYNTRNDNNPAQAKLGAQLLASAMAIYQFRIAGRKLTARYEADFPFFGLMFSPHYGQSYYEIFGLNHSDHNVCVTYPGNAPSMSHLLTLDIPMFGATLRTGYLCNIRQSHVNSLKSHEWSHLFLIGYVKHFALIK